MRKGLKGIMYTITSHSKYDDGSEHSFLVRITPDLEFARKLMQSIYDDAERHRETRIATYSDPVWKDEEHCILEVKSTIYCGWMKSVTTETFYLGDEYDKNYLSDKPWVLE